MFRWDESEGEYIQIPSNTISIIRGWMRATNHSTREGKSTSWDLGASPEAERDTKQEELFLPKGNF